MALMITDDCINCGACESECPNTAIYRFDTEWEFGAEKHPPLSTEIYYIVPDKCTECVCFLDEPQCAEICPMNCCVPNPDYVETSHFAGKEKALIGSCDIVSLSERITRF